MIAIIICIMSLLNLCLIYIIAYISPQKAVIVYIDIFGEAEIEMIILGVGLLTAPFLLGVVKELAKKWNEAEK